MTPRTLLGLAAITGIAALGAVAAVIVKGDSTTAYVSTEQPMFPQITQRIDDVAQVRIASPDGELVLERRDGGWVMPDRGGYPVRAGLADRLVSDLAALKRYEPKTENPTWYSRIGVEDVTAEGARSRMVTVAAADGSALATVLVGQPSSSIGANPLGGTFVRQPGEAEAWLAEGTVNVPQRLPDWFDPLVHVPGTEVKTISILEGDELVYEATKPEGSIRYELVSVAERYARPGTVAADTAVKRVAQGIVSTTLDDVRPADTVTWAENGRRVRFLTAKGMTVEAALGEADGQSWVRFTASAPADSEAATQATDIAARTAGWAYRLPAHKMSALAQDVATLLEAPQTTPQSIPGGVPGMPGMPPGMMQGMPPGPPFAGDGNPPTLPTLPFPPPG